MIYTNHQLWKAARRTVCIAAVAAVAVATGLTAYNQFASVPSTTNQRAAAPRQSSEMAEIVITASRHSRAPG